MGQIEGEISDFFNDISVNFGSPGQNVMKSDLKKWGKIGLHVNKMGLVLEFLRSVCSNFFVHRAKMLKKTDLKESQICLIRCLTI